MNWTSTSWPGWSDAGRLVEIEMEDGQTLQGTLEVDDFFTDGEGDEVPVFIIRTSDGAKHSFVDHKRWRRL
jgi:hypothetical protein